MMSLLIECSIRAALVAGAVTAVILGLRIVKARERHLAWCGVLLTMLLLPALCTWGPRAGIPLLPGGDEPAGGAPWTAIDAGLPAASTTTAKPSPSRAAPLPVR